MSPAATVIIPHYDDRTRLQTCLASLSRCTDRSRVEVIVIDNGEATLDDAFKRRHPDVRFAFEPMKGAAHARNLGAALAQGRCLIFTDSDCIVSRDFLSQALKAGRAYDIAGGAIRSTVASGLPPNPVQAFEKVFAFNQRHYVTTKGFSVTANLVTNADVFHVVGPFRAGLSEDYDWCKRANSQGFQVVYEPRMIVEHPCRASWDQLRSKWQRITVESYGLHQAQGRNKALWLIRALFMPCSITVHTPRILRSSELANRREKAGALLTLARLRLWRMREMIRVAWLQDPANFN